MTPRSEAWPEAGPTSIADRNDALLTRAALDPPRHDIIRVQTVTRP